MVEGGFIIEKCVKGGEMGLKGGGVINGHSIGRGAG